jgi:hypothetical protein
MNFVSKCASSLMHACKSQRLQRFAVFSMLLLAFSVCAFAQDATIVGTVTDPSGSVVPNATITATALETGLVRTVKSGDGGQYLVSNLPIGHYNIKVEATGFKSAEKTNLTLNVDDRIRMDFDLKVGSTGESVTVEANVVKVQTESGEMSSLITGQQTTQLATNGRSLFQLYNLTTGASSLQGDFAAPTPVTGDKMVSFNGNREGHNLMILDGGENLDRGGAGPSVMPSIDAIAEFRLNTSAFSAEYGLSSGATITTAIKSGTKSFHGGAWEFDRNDAFNARDFNHPAKDAFHSTSSPIAELRFNTFGFNVGGPVPIWKDSHPTFFFANIEWRRLLQGATLNQTVPLSSTYGGDFSGVTGLALANFHAPFDCQISAVQQAKFSAVSQPLSSCATSTLAAWNGSKIDPSLLSANAPKLLSAGIFTKENSTAVENGVLTGRFKGGAAVPVNLSEQLFRIDHQFSQKFSVFGHYIQEQVTQGFVTTQWSGDNVPSVGDNMGNPSYSAVVHTTHIISPTLLNESSFNYNGNRINITPTGVFAAPSTYGFNRLFPGENQLNRFPQIQLNGLATYSSNWTPWVNKADDYQFRDDVSLTKGAHQFKLGGSWALYKKAQDLFANTEGNYTFQNGASSYTGNSFADFLLGYANSYSEAGIKDSRQYNNQSWAAYVQDNWRVNNKLTLNLGVRWDGMPHTYEPTGTLANFYPDLYNSALKPTFTGPTSNQIDTSATPAGAFTSNPNLPGILLYTNGIGVNGVNGTPKGLTQNSWRNFAPRVGFAYDVSGQGKTVVRGAFGVFYERVQGNDSYNSGPNVPFSANPSLPNVLLDNPHTQVIDNSSVTIPVVPSGITGLSRNYPPPTSYQYNFGIQQALNSRTVLSLNYVGNQLRNQSDFREINMIPQSLLATQASLPNLNQARPYAGFGGIRLAENVAQGHYNGFQTELRGQLSKDLNLQIGYTISKAVDPTTGGGNDFDLDNITNPYAGWRYDQGPSIFDRTHVGFVNFVYDLPFMRNSSSHVAKSVLGGWQMSGIVSMSSGAPLNITLSSNPLSNAVPNSGNRPDLVGDVSYTKRYVGGQFQWFSPSSFVAPTNGTYGNLPHDFLRGPGRQNWNLSLFKTFNFTERVHFELRAESFNTWNHLQFKGDVQQGGIGQQLGGGGFGSVTAAYDPRTLQLGGKILF